ncbi:hypothetical protein B0T09DRAFT_184695 [Sordaria sp. MPI-SDFR-AT-0083]|nr:hypothetical protein B0T09DRAFT_184695 [Sordaria sp. MPI-SDFR-AT-0083]
MVLAFSGAACLGLITLRLTAWHVLPPFPSLGRRTGDDGSSSHRRTRNRRRRMRERESKTEQERTIGRNRKQTINPSLPRQSEIPSTLGSPCPLGHGFTVHRWIALPSLISWDLGDHRQTGSRMDDTRFSQNLGNVAKKLREKNVSEKHPIFWEQQSIRA